MLNTLTDQQEAKTAFPWKVSDAPSDYIERQLGGIVGLEITLDSLEGKWKLSQNQTTQNQTGVMQGLSESTHSDATAMAMMMKEYLGDSDS
jgi:transcriptional regulator